jgi:uracil phosphoribosyltransferase
MQQFGRVFAEISALICLFASSEGIECFCNVHSYVSLYTATIDDYLAQ